MPKVSDDRPAWIHRRLLEIGRVNERRSWLSQAKMPDVPDDTDNLSRACFVNRIWIIAQEYLLPDGILVREKAMHEGFVDNDDPWGCQRVVFVQVAALFERNLQSA